METVFHSLGPRTSKEASYTDFERDDELFFNGEMRQQVPRRTPNLIKEFNAEIIRDPSFVDFSHMYRHIYHIMFDVINDKPESLARGVYHV